MKTNNNNEISKRLEAVIFKYFGKQVEFASQTGLTAGSINNILKGRNKISKQILLQIQNKTGVNADFILNGNLPMMLNETDPIYENDTLSILEQIEKRQDAKLISKGKYLLASNKQGNREKLIETGEGNVAEFAYGNLKDIWLILCGSSRFCEKYSITLNSLLIVSKCKFLENDIVLICVDRIYYLTEYKHKQLVDIADSKIKFSIDEKVKIIGLVYSKIERF